MVSLVCLTILPSSSYGADWVYVDRDKESTQYYQSSSVKIDKQKNTIEVWVRHVFTDKGKSDFLEKQNIKIKQKYIDINYQLKHYLLNYKEIKSSTLFIAYYSKSDSLLFHREYLPEWKNIIPDSYLDKLTKQLVKDYNIKK